MVDLRRLTEQAAAVLMAVALFAATVRGQVMMDLAQSTADVEIIGEPAQHKTGHALAIGDVNGDGVGDLLIGAPDWPDADWAGRGAVYVFFGSADFPATIDLTQSRPDFHLTIHRDGSALGLAVAAGDFNGDGLADIAAGAPGADSSDAGIAGGIFIVFGSRSLVASREASAADVHIIGTPELEEFGGVLALADLNNDGKDDLIAGIPLADRLSRVNAGKVLAFFGNAAPPAEIKLAQVPPDVEIIGPRKNQRMGNAVAASDLNADGYADLLIGDFKGDVPSGVDAGFAYVVFMQDSLFGTSLDLAFTEPDVTISGRQNQDHLGYAVDIADFSGDGRPDVIVGARWADHAGFTNSGKAYIFANTGAWPANIDLREAAPSLTITGVGETINLGYALASGNINGDVYADLAIGAVFSRPQQRPAAGASFVVLGRQLAAETGEVLSAAADLAITGARENDFLGNALAVGDLNGDELDDIVLAAEDAPPAGRVYVIWGDVATSVVSEEAPAAPRDFGLLQNYPNPFSKSTEFILQGLRNARDLEIAIYNIMGQTVTTIRPHAEASSAMLFRWDGTDASGSRAGAGIYFYILRTGERQVQRGKLVLLK